MKESPIRLFSSLRCLHLIVLLAMTFLPGVAACAEESPKDPKAKEEKPKDDAGAKPPVPPVPPVPAKPADEDAEKLKTLKVGDKLEYIYAGSWYKGVVAQIGEGRDAGYYHVKDEKGALSWVKADRIKWNEPTPATVEAKDTLGLWDGLATVIRSEDTDKYRGVKITETSAHYVPNSLTIRQDGTYIWVIGKESVIEGKWDKEPKPVQYKGPVILRKGLFGNDWWVNYEGKDAHGKESIYIRSEFGTRYWASKAKPAKKQEKKEGQK